VSDDTLLIVVLAGMHRAAPGAAAGLATARRRRSRRLSVCGDPDRRCLGGHARAAPGMSPAGRDQIV